MEESQINQNIQNKKPITKINLFLIVAIFALVLFNQFQLSNLNKLEITGNIIKDIKETSETSGQSSSTIPLQAALNEIISKGIPEIYGKELVISYDDPVKGMNVLNQYDDLTDQTGRGSKAITLSPEKQQRYLKITNSIGCEFCCGAQTLTTKSGEPACGCAHSGAMRGLAKYLLDKHPEMADEQILSELVKWKILFFPKDMAKQYLASKGISVSANDLPSQVGGC
ncbi:MAG: hypothetical protein AABW41_00585 [Nanoarchaeota archaeon]